MADFAAFCRKPPSIENCRVYSDDKSKGAYQFSGNNANPGDFLGIDRPARFWTSSEMEIDGRWHRRRLPKHGYRPPLSDLVPGRQFDNIFVDLSRGWSAVAISFGVTMACFITTFVCKMFATEVFFDRVMPELWAWLPVVIFMPVAFIELDSMKT